jgi:hypothetical protein
MFSKKTFLLLLVLLLSACNLPIGGQPGSMPDAPPFPASPSTLPPQPSATAAETVQSESSQPGEPLVVAHVLFPGEIGDMGILYYDVESSGTGPQKRAPFGDVYRLNLLERPFDQDMNYIADLDIRTFRLTAQDIWYYVTIETIGRNPNNDLGLHFGVILDVDKDGYGDFLLWAAPPYTENWTATNLQVFADQNRDSAGTSPSRSDAPFNGDGYETLIFDLNQGIGADVDLAWVRQSGANTIQFAFKQELTGTQFMFGVIADAGLKDPGRMDYVDYLTESQAGSPVRDNQYYPLKELFLLDTTCHAAFGFAATGYEPKICPRIIPVGQSTSPAGGSGGEATPPPMTGCPTPMGGSCTDPTPFFWPYPHCACSSQPFYAP